MAKRSFNYTISNRQIPISICLEAAAIYGRAAVDPSAIKDARQESRAAKQANGYYPYPSANEKSFTLDRNKAMEVLNVFLAKDRTIRTYLIKIISESDFSMNMFLSCNCIYESQKVKEAILAYLG